jgi:Fur family ferric uptake transcriptional regulator
MWPVERLHTELIRHKVSQTRARDEIYVTLGRIGPCQISTLIEQLNGQFGQMTVYRTINLFIKIGVASRPSHNLVELNAPFRQHHHHITCPRCGKITDFLNPILEARLEKIAKSRRIELKTHQIELFAVCGLCLS